MIQLPPESTAAQSGKEWSLHISFKRQLLLAGPLFSGTLVCLSTCLLLQGFTLETLDATSKTSKQLEQLVEKYNAYVGMVVAVFVKPLELFVEMVFPVTMLCFATTTVLRHDRKCLATMLLTGGSAGLLWLLSSALGGLNVQRRDSYVEPVMGISDMSNTKDLITADTHRPFQYNQSGNPSNRTLLRSAIVGGTVALEKSRWSKPTKDRFASSVEYGFPMQPWLHHVLPTAMDPASIGMHVREMTRHSDPPTEQLPMSIAKASNLFFLGFSVVDRFFRDQTAMEAQDYWFSITNCSRGCMRPRDYFSLKTLPTELAVSTESPATKEATKTFFASVARQLRNITHDQVSLWENVSMEDARVTFDVVEIGPGMVYDAVTLDLPLYWTSLERENNASVFNQNVTYEPTFSYDCNMNSCLMRNAGERDRAIDSQVRAFALQVEDSTGLIDVNRTVYYPDVSKHVHNAMGVFSVAKRFTGSSAEHAPIEFYTDNHTVWSNSTVVTMRSPVKSLMITIGVLRWNTSRLNDTFHAECIVPSGCDGLSIPAANGDKSLVVHVDSLPVHQLRALEGYPADWTLLASVRNIMSVALYDDFMFPDNFHSKWLVKNVTGPAPPPYSMAQVEILTAVDNYLRSVEANHFYSEHSLQPSYTAAIFWLFQDGVMHDVLNKKMDSHKHSVWTLKLAASREFVQIRLTLPSDSAQMAVAGAVILVALSVAVFVVAKRQEQLVNDQLQVLDILRAILGQAPFGEKFVTRNLVLTSVVDEIVVKTPTGDQMVPTSVALDDMEVLSVSLRHKSHDSGKIIHLPSSASDVQVL